MSLKRLIFYLLLIAAATTFIYPFLWMTATSLKPASEIHTFTLFSSNFSFDNYYEVFRRIPIGRALFNSFVVASTSTVSVIFFSSMVGYALAKLQFKGRNLIFMILIFSMMIPGQLTLIPLYQLIVKFGWVDSYFALIVPTMVSAMGILIFRQTFKGLPYELIEAARMEGASEFTILTKIFWPLSLPAMVTVGILNFMGSWNEVLWPMSVIREQEMMTMPQMVVLFSKGGQAGGSLGIELAAAMILVVPIVIAYSFFQRYFIESMAGSGIKG